MPSVERHVDYTERLVTRSLPITRKRPQPPRELAYSNGVLSWKPPAETWNVTHYRIYGPDDRTMVRQVPEGQRQLADNLALARVFVSSYNHFVGLESERVVLATTIGQSVVTVQHFSLGTGALTITAPTGTPTLHVVSIQVTSATPGAVTWNAVYQLMGNFAIDPLLNSYFIMPFILRNAQYWPLGGVNGAL